MILTLKNEFKSAEIFYLGAHENHFNGKLKEYDIPLKTLDINLKYFGFRWWHYFKAKKEFLKLNIEKFDLIIDLQSKIRNTIILKKIPFNFFFSTTFNFYFSSKKNLYLKKDSFSDTILENLNIILKKKIEKKFFDINDLNQIYLNEAKRLLPDNNYIGFSVTQGNVYRKKSWAIENFIKVAKELEKRKKKIVFFLEKKDFENMNKIKSHIPNAIFPEHHSEISCPALVTALSLRLEKAISIDNGIMHMMSLSKVPMIILFGPTNSKKFAPGNNNIKILDSKTLYKSNDIGKIKVEDVMNCFNF